MLPLYYVHNGLSVPPKTVLHAYLRCQCDNESLWNLFPSRDQHVCSAVDLAFARFEAQCTVTEAAPPGERVAKPPGVPIEIIL